MDAHHKFARDWLYDLDEYQRMFDLTDNDLDSCILDFAPNISSFNAQMKDTAHHVVSVDPIYVLSTLDMQRYVNTVLDHLAEKFSDDADIENKMGIWRGDADLFISDYGHGIAENRYLALQDDFLPFLDREFNLALCGGFAFANAFSDPLTIVTELCRVAHEVRIFPLLNAEGEVSEKLAPVMMHLQHQGYGVELKEVPFTIGKKGNAMLRIWSLHCDVIAMA